MKTYKQFVTEVNYRVLARRQQQYNQMHPKPPIPDDEAINTKKSDVYHQTGTSISAGDKAYHTLKQKYPDVHDYIKNQSPVAIDPVQTLQMLKQGMPAHHVIGMIKKHLELDAQKQYGAKHPSYA